MPITDETQKDSNSLFAKNETQNILYIMDDGTKVYAVTFTPQLPESKELQKEQNSPKDENKQKVSAPEATSKISIFSGLLGRRPSGRE